MYRSFYLLILLTPAFVPACCCAEAIFEGLAEWQRAVQTGSRALDARKSLVQQRSQYKKGKQHPLCNCKRLETARRWSRISCSVLVRGGSSDEGIPLEENNTGSGEVTRPETPEADQFAKQDAKIENDVVSPQDSSFGSSSQSQSPTTAFVQRTSRIHQQQPQAQQASASQDVLDTSEMISSKLQEGLSSSPQVTHQQHQQQPAQLPRILYPLTLILKIVLSPITLLGAAVASVFRNPLCLYYLCALLGTSVGFVQFLYFSTLGYALGVALPVVVSLLRRSSSSSATSTISSWLVVLWAVRLGAFLLWREHVNWPALHTHMQWVTPPPLSTQVLGWVAYSALYLAVASPCLFFPNNNHKNKATTRSSGRSNPLAVALQVFGLVLETVADYQKSHFKALHRQEWCHVGVWKYSTYPNYLGEALFWLGTHLSALGGRASSGDGSSSSVHHLDGDKKKRSAVLLPMLFQLSASFVGLAFVFSILRGAILHLRDTQDRKYGQDPLFRSFRDDYCLMGYKFWKHYELQIQGRAIRIVGKDSILTAEPATGVGADEATAEVSDSTT